MPADYDGDKKADITMWRPATGQWLIINSTDGNARTLVLGASGDTPVPKDYDGDNKLDAAVWQPDTGQWSITNSSDG